MNTSKHPGYAALIFLALYSGAAWTQAAAIQPLKHNPFSKPDKVKRQAAGSASGKPAPIQLELRATLVSKQSSSADINGHVVGIGEFVNGYQLIRVSERRVVLTKNGALLTLKVKNDEAK